MRQKYSWRLKRSGGRPESRIETGAVSRLEPPIDNRENCPPLCRTEIYSIWRCAADPGEGLRVKGKELLFVTYNDDNFDEGLSYAVDLTKAMGDSIRILMVYKGAVIENFEDMTKGEIPDESKKQKTAGEQIREDYSKSRKSFENKLSLIKEKCREAGVSVDISTAAADAVTAIRNILRQNTRIDVVLLSPGITNDADITSKTLNKLVKTASRPIVTMAKQAGTA